MIIEPEVETQKQKERKEIQEQIEMFLQNGGTIKQCQIGETAYMTNGQYNGKNSR